MKMKKFLSEEYKLIGYTEGKKGKDKKLIMWMLETEEGKEFTVRPNETAQKRKQLYDDMTEELFDREYKNQLMTLEYSELTVDKIPCHITNCIIRNYE